MHGIWALIWPGDTKMMGMGWPLTVTQLLPRAVGTGICFVARLVGFNWLPKIVISPPGATGDLSSAALTTAETEGGATAASYAGGRTVNPEVDRLMISLWSLSTASVRVKAEVAMVAAVPLLPVVVLQDWVVLPLLVLVVHTVVVMVVPFTHVSVLVDPVVTVVHVCPVDGADAEAPNNGASIIRVGRIPLAEATLTCWMTPGLAEFGAVVR